MTSLLKKLFGTLSQKPWEEKQMEIDSAHKGYTFNLSNQMSAVIIIFGVSTTLFSLLFTGYIYSLPPEQDTTFILKKNLLFFIYFFDHFCNCTMTFRCTCQEPVNGASAIFRRTVLRHF